MRVLLALLLLSCVAARASEGFGFEDFLLAPLRIHLWAGKDEAGLKTTLAVADVERILGKVNLIWAQAGIAFWLESIHLEEAPVMKEGETVPDDLPGAVGWLPRHVDGQAFGKETFNVYYLGRFGVNGICYPKVIFVKDTAKLRMVLGGLDEPIPRVTAHELGHALGLPHRQDVFNLMASGTSATSLNAEEIERTRLTALAMKDRFVSGADFLRLVKQNPQDGARWSVILPLDTENFAPLKEALPPAPPAPAAK